MTCSEFNALAPNKRSALVWDWGFIISDRKTETQNMVLFAMGDFFVELGFSRKNEQLCSIKGMTKEELHSGYSLRIDQENPFFRAARVSNKYLIEAA
jgi:hypothetical protein